MNRETTVWTVVFLLGAVLLAIRGVMVGGLFGTAYVKVDEREFVKVATDDGETLWVDAHDEDALDYDLTQAPESDRRRWTTAEQATPIEYQQAVADDPNQTQYRFSLSRTLGIWIAAFFTLAIFSFLYKDNPFYKVAESVVVGVSAAYWMVVGFWNVLVPNLFGMIEPRLVNTWAMPGLDSTENHWIFIVPLVFGIMLLMRLSPKGSWIARWPLAFFIGVFCGIRLLGFLHADFLSQIRNSVVSLYVTDGGGMDILWDSLRNLILVIGVLACLVYFFFSFEHKGMVGRTARLGIWFLMITFGAGFGFTVMGRIALLAIRLEFLFDDWLWLIDPTSKRLADVAGMLMPSLSIIT